jgi:hypothetical protein
MPAEAEQIEEELPPEGETPPEPELSAEDKQYEERARRQGWRPKEEYSGNADRWVDAKTFVLRGEAELPLIRERFRKMDQQFAETKTELNDTKKKLSEASEVLVELRDMSLKAEERAYNRAMQDIRRKQQAAVREANEEAFNAAAAEAEQLGPPPAPPPKRPDPAARTETPPPPPNTVQPDPAVIQWVGENPWFNNDQVLHYYAIDEENKVKAEFPGMSVAEQLAEVKQRTMDRFPEKFNNTRRRAPPAVASSQAPPAKAKGKTVKDLPPDARAALAKFKAQMPKYTDAEYLRMYYGPDEEIA